MAAIGLVSVILAAATVPIAIRFAQQEGVPSLAIITLRLWMITLALAPVIAWRYLQFFKILTRWDWFWVLLAGGLHAFNLVTLFYSLEYTSVLISSVLRRTAPLWVVIFEILLLDAVFYRRVWWGVVLTVFGTTVVGLGVANLETGLNPLLGGGLALANALTNAFYLLIGRKLRSRLPYLPYSWAVFLGAAMITSLVVLWTQIPLAGYTARGYFWVVIITVFSQVFGHIPINAVLRFYSATTVSMVMQVSVVIAAILAYYAFGELPSALQLAGSVFVVAGVVLVLRERIM